MARETAADNNIYTVMVFIAFVALLAAVVFVFMQLGQLEVSPFKVEGQAMLDTARQALGLA